MHPKKIWFLFLLQLVIITDIVSLRKNFLLKITAEIGIINTFGQCFKYISTDSVDPREGQGKKDFFVICMCALSLRICITSYYIHFSSCLQFRIFSQWQKIVLETNYSALFNKKTAIFNFGIWFRTTKLRAVDAANKEGNDLSYYSWM